jgi:hypothetical protein
MGAILRNDGLGGAGAILPSRLEFTFYEIALATAQHRDARVYSLGGGWYCYAAPPWFFTYRKPEWAEQELRACAARVRRLLW